MEKRKREEYIFKKKSLLILLYLFYLNEVDYKDINFKSFGFHFDPSSDFKAIVTSKKGHIHKYVIHSFISLNRVNLEELDEMGNVNFFKVKRLNQLDPYIPSSCINIYFDDSSFLALGFIEGKKCEYKIENKEDGGLLYLLNESNKDVKSSFIMFLLKLYTYRLNVDLVIGAGINVEYGCKDWKNLVDALNNNFYKNDLNRINDIKHYVGSELFVNGKVLKTSGFDTYKELNDEIYLLNKGNDNFKTFNDKTTNLSSLADYIEKHNHTNVITYNYDTNLEYILKKRNVIYTSIYDDSAFTSKDSKATIYHVHGLLPFEKYEEERYLNSLVFNESDYYSLYNNPYSWNISKQLNDFCFNACIFAGISLKDPNMKRLLELASNTLKFNFIFMKKEENIKEETYKDITNYFFTYDLIPIWLNDYKEIGEWLSELS